MSIVGYCIEGKARTGEKGLAYDYVMAGNGLWLEAKNDHLEARVLLASAEVRGLVALEPRLVLRHGHIPERVWNHLSDMLHEQPDREVFMAVGYVGHQYDFTAPPQQGTSMGVLYRPVPDAMFEAHSHPNMRAFFSGTDNADEQSFRLYAVLGWNDQTGRKEVHIRLGIYGYFVDVPWDQVFDGMPEGWVDLTKEEVPLGLAGE